MKKLISITALVCVMSSCSYSVSMIHSAGSTDTLDEAQTTSPDVSPNISVPISAVPALPSIPGITAATPPAK